MKLIKDIYSKRAICIFAIESRMHWRAIDAIPYPMKSEMKSKCGMNLEPSGSYLGRRQTYAGERADSGMALEKLN